MNVLALSAFCANRWSSAGSSLAATTVHYSARHEGLLVALNTDAVCLIRDQAFRVRLVAAPLPSPIERRVCLHDK